MTKEERKAFDYIEKNGHQSAKMYKQFKSWTIEELKKENRMADIKFYSSKCCPNCKHNNKHQADLYLLHGKGKCWDCGSDMKNFEQSETSRQKLKQLEEEK